MRRKREPRRWEPDRVYVRPHAIERLEERFQLGLGPEEARRLLRDLYRLAAPVGAQRSRDRLLATTLPDGRPIVLVSKPGSRGPWISTVLTPDQAVQNMQDRGLGQAGDA